MATSVRMVSSQRYLALTERLVDLIEYLLLECLVSDQSTDACKTLGHLVGWQSPHEIEHRFEDSLLLLTVGRTNHFGYYDLILGIV